MECRHVYTIAAEAIGPWIALILLAAGAWVQRVRVGVYGEVSNICIATVLFLMCVVDVLGSIRLRARSTSER